jgi:hypothetical protein
MKNLTFLIFFVLLPFWAQSQNEIDILVEKYGEKQFVIYTSSGELEVKSTILKNGDSPPYSIVISGELELLTDYDHLSGGGKPCDIVATFLLDVILQKKTEGYKLVQDKTGIFPYNTNKSFICQYSHFQVEYAKSNYLFKATREFVEQKKSYENYMSLHNPHLIKFSIEMIDKNRIGTKDSKTFKF